MGETVGDLLEGLDGTTDLEDETVKQPDEAAGLAEAAVEEEVEAEAAVVEAVVAAEDVR